MLNLSSQSSFHFLILTDNWQYPEDAASPGSLTNGSCCSYTVPTDGPRADVVVSLNLASFQITDALSCLKPSAAGLTDQNSYLLHSSANPQS